MSEKVEGYDESRDWRKASELPVYVFEALSKRDRAINPVTIIASIDADGWPRTAPFGSVRAITPKLVRMISLRYHDTYVNLCRDGRVALALVAPPDIAVSIRGKAKLVKEAMDTGEHYAVLDIDVDEVKNDMVRSGVIGSAITFFPHGEIESWFDAALAEIENM
jgi:hypothetical protein